MQKQQRNAETVLLQERLDGYKTVFVKRYKILNDVVFMDSFVLTAESEVRCVVGSEDKAEYINVVYECDESVRRIMWIKKDNTELISSNDEQWDINKYENEIMDKNENWFD